MSEPAERQAWAFASADGEVAGHLMPWLFPAPPVGEGRSLPNGVVTKSYFTPGFRAHASVTGALYSSRGPIACRVRLSGDMEDLGPLNGIVAQRFDTLAMADASVPINRFALWCLDSMRPYAGVYEQICRDTVRVIRGWLSNEATVDELRAAHDGVLGVLDRDSLRRYTSYGRLTPDRRFDETLRTQARAVIAADLVCESLLYPPRRDCWPSTIGLVPSQIVGVVDVATRDKKLTELLSTLPGFGAA